jgi:hypothetical protein
LTSRKTILLECENEEEFQEMLVDYVATYRPGSPVESSLVDEMVAARWRMQRLRMIEAALFDSEMNREHLPTDLQPEPTDPGYQIAAAFRRLADESRALSLASRYESRLHRIHERSHRTLRELQETRKQETAEQALHAPSQPEPPPTATVEPVPVVLNIELAHPSSEPPLQLLHRDKKLRNEPGSPVSRHLQSHVITGHRGIMSYIGSNRLRCLQQLKTA